MRITQATPNKSPNGIRKLKPSIRHSIDLEVSLIGGSTIVSPSFHVFIRGALQKVTQGLLQKTERNMLSIKK